LRHGCITRLVTVHWPGRSYQSVPPHAAECVQAVTPLAVAYPRFHFWGINLKKYPVITSDISKN